MSAGDLGRVGAAAERCRESGADELDRLVEDDAEVPAAVLQLVEDRDPAGRVAVGQRRDQPLDRFRVGQAEQVAHAGLGDAAAGRREELVEHRLRVAHAAGSEAGDEVDRGRLGLDRLGREDPLELALDLRAR